MATGRSMQLTKQVGEYLVAAEVCRRGLIATTFTGNVPTYDIVAITEGGKSVLIQVKASRKGWQFGDSRRFLEIRQDGERQIPGRRKTPEHSNLVYVFVLLAAEDEGRDRFFILEALDLHHLIATHYRKYIHQKDGVRPKKHDSYHFALGSDHLAKYEDQWEMITRY